MLCTPWPVGQDGQVQAARASAGYCLCLLSVEAGAMRLVETVPGENGVVCVFESSAGEKFSLTRPAMSEEQEAVVVERLREILTEEGW